MALGPLRFRPVLRPLVWGGRRLHTVLGRDLPDGEDIGESWEVVDLPSAVSHVDGGPLDGTGLDHLVRERAGELLGRSAPASDGRFPVLVKLLDAHHMLSVQVHPSAARVAQAAGRPKTEAWFVLHAEPEAELLIGLRPGVTKDQVRGALGGDGLPELLIPHAARPGEVHLIEAGTVHCLGAGVLLAEIQQPSETTYRLHDWGRGRPLHVAEALDSIHWDRAPHRPAGDASVQCPAFSARWIRGGGEEPASERCRVLLATSAGALDGAPLRAGDTVVLPASCRDLTVREADYIRVSLP